MRDGLVAYRMNSGRGGAIACTLSAGSMKGRIADWQGSPEPRRATRIYRIEHGAITTIHDVTNTQVIVG